MRKELQFHGKMVDVTLTESAALKSKEIEYPLLIEIQIYFSCVLVKRAAIYSDTEQEGVWHLEAEQFSSMLGVSQPFSDKLHVRFNTVMTTICPVSDYSGPPPVTDFKVHRESAYVPRWLIIDYRGGRWFGDYGWRSSIKGESNTLQLRGEPEIRT